MENKPLRKWMILIAYTLLLVLVLVYLKEIGAGIAAFFQVLKPFIIGIIIAFVVNLLMKFLEERAFRKLNEKKSPIWQKLRRPICLILALFIAICIIGFAIYIILPQLAESIMMLINHLPGYLDSIIDMLAKIPGAENIGEQIYQLIDEQLLKWSTEIGVIAQNVLAGALTVTIGIASGVLSAVVGFILSVYMLFNKEKLLNQMKNLLRAALPEKISQKVLEIAALTNDTFNKFFAGQLLECLIIGILCYAGTMILRIPYAVLISVIVAITNIVPIFGPILGTIPCVLILLAIDPMKALIFLIFILVMQQIEGNVIYPRVVGNNVGLSAIWIIFAVVVGGGLFGIAGIILGIPLLAVCSKLLKRFINRKLAEKKMSPE